MYEVLGIPATADSGQVELAYKEKLAQLVEHASVGEQATLHQIEELKAAHEILTSPARRARYEHDLQQSRDFYQLLGIPLTATPNEINAAYQDSILRVVSNDALDWADKQARIEAIKQAYRAIIPQAPREQAAPGVSRFQFNDLNVPDLHRPAFPPVPQQPRQAGAPPEPGRPPFSYRGWMLAPIFGLMLVFFIGLDAILGLFTATGYGSLWSIAYSALLVVLLALDTVTLYLIYLRDRRTPLYMIGTYWLGELILAAGLAHFWAQYHSWESYPLWRLKLFAIGTIVVIIFTDYLLRSQRIKDTFDRQPGARQPPVKA